ncbi:MAG: tetratricopeptide repeat protein [Planctomycetes bacterium]|nr:tetratricopeptide repeat protein [Planctomycetota bacterium]
MSIGKLLLILVVMAGIAAGVLSYMGVLKFDPNGVQMDSQALQSATEMSEYAKGALAYSKDEWGDCISHYKAALAADPNNNSAPDAMYRIAWAYDQMDRVSEAQAAYKEFITSFPEAAQVSKAKLRMDFLANSAPK